MPKKITDNSENYKLCANCDNCCRYIAIEIDRPTTKADYHNLIWFLLHENICIYIGFDRHWYLEVITPCKKLKNKLCSDYENRPAICREYLQTDCTKYNNEKSEKIYFSSADQFKTYLKKKKIKI